MATAKTAHRLELVVRARRSGEPDTRHVVNGNLHILLTVDEAAEQLGIGRSTMYVLITKGEIASLHVGRLRRIEPAALADYIAQQRQRTAS